MLRPYILSTYFGKSFINYLIFSTLLLGPAVFFSTHPINITQLVRIPSEITLDFSMSKFAKVVPWIIVGLTAILTVVGNTVVYFFTFITEVSKATEKQVKNYFYVIVLFFFLWIIHFFWTLFLCYHEFSLFASKIATQIEIGKMQNYQSVEIDVPLLLPLNHMVEGIVQIIEMHLFTTIFLFIAIDTVSWVVKGIQIKNSQGSKRAEYVLEKEFVKNQLFIIDIPVILGMSLVLFFLNRSMNDVISEDLKSIFSLGGIAMHIILSQIIFVILDTQFSYKNFLHTRIEHFSKNHALTEKAE